MGGLSRYLPYTTGLMWIGALALAGVPPFSGFFSKDQILADALARGDWVGYTVWGLGLAGAFVTALYTFRLMLLVFHGRAQRVRARARRGARRPRRGAVLDALDDRRARRRRDLRRVPGDPAGHARHAQLPRADHPRPSSRRPAARSSAASALAVGRRARRARRGVSCCGGGAARRPRRIAARPRRSSACCRRSSASTCSTTGPSTGPAAALARAARGSGRARRGRQHGRRQRRRLLGEPPALDRAVRARARLRPGVRARHRGARRVVRDGRLVSGSWTVDAALARAARRGPGRARAAAARRDAAVPSRCWRRSRRPVLALAAAFDFDPSGGDAVRAVARLGARPRPRPTTSAWTGSRWCSSALTARLRAVCLGFGLWARRPACAPTLALIAAARVRARCCSSSARDLVLFYVGFEAMLIPLALLIAVWGGANAQPRDDALRHLHAGRLAADAGRR